MLKNYLLIAIRNFRKNKVFSFINILGLTLGLACSLALYMIVRYEGSFDGFHQKRDRIFRVVSDFRYPEGVEHQCGVPYPLPQAFKNDFPQLEKVVSIMGDRNTQITIPTQQQGAAPARFLEKNGFFYTEPAFFDLFDFTWISGSPEDALSQPNTVALTREIAEKYFGSWKNAIGKTIRTDEPEMLTVKGILENPPPNTDFPIKGLISFSTTAGNIQGKGWGTVSSQFQCYILLPQNLAVSQINRLLPAFLKKNRDNKTDFFALQPLRDIHFNSNYGNFGDRTANKETLWALSLIGVFLLALGCINFINLATAQAVNRSREVGIRKVLGSQRWHLALQFLGETAFLVGISVILAVGLLTVLSPFAGQLINGNLPLEPLHSTSAMVFISLTALIVTLVSGAYPAFALSGFRPMAALKNKIAAGGRQNGILLRRVLVVSQFAIAQTLIIGVLVAISQMNFFRSAPLGFNKEAIVTVSLPADSINRTKWESFRQQLLQQSGVENVSLSYSPPSGSGTNFSSFRYNQDSRDDNFEINLKLADTAYQNTYRLSLVAGRFYLPSDTIREWVVNETFLKKEGIRDPNEALGKYIYMGNSKAPIVGVVRDFHEHSLRDPIDPAAITTQKHSYRMAGIRLNGRNLSTTIASIEKIFNGYFPETLFQHQFLSETIARFYEQEEKLAKIFKVFAAIALTISCLGLYGLILFSTSQRVKEVGVRKVLGASLANISFLFIREFLWLIGIAFVIASPLAWYFMHKWLQNFTYRISLSAWMFIATGLTALLIGLLTIGFQTLKAALANPVKALRSE